MVHIQKMEFTEISHAFSRGGQDISFSTGKLAPQADSSVLVTMGKNILLINIVLEKSPNTDIDFTPLTVDWRDYFPAAGKIGGGQYRKREGRPSDAVVLYARMTDRAIRPLLPKGMVNPLVITVTPIQIDREHDLGAMSIFGSSVALQQAGIPLASSIGAVRIGYNDGGYIINPTRAQVLTGTMNLLIAGPKGLINMIEADGKQVPDDIALEGMRMGQEYIDTMIQEQATYLAKCTVNAQTIVQVYPSDTLIQQVSTCVAEDMHLLFGQQKVAFNDTYRILQNKVMDTLQNDIADSNKKEYTNNLVKIAFFTVVKSAIRTRTLQTGKRVDDRSVEDIRPLLCEVGMYERLHGTGLFWRGDTQVLSTVTLGAPGEVEVADTMEEDQVERRYMHHYNFPGFSVNDAKPMRGPGRREIGHGALAEKALEHVLPLKSSFPYTMRVVSECLSSGGSTSQASVCGSTLALLDAGVPLIAPVAGIAMGLMTTQRAYGEYTDRKVLTDLMGTEDFVGDMDFKIAGSTSGITAIQLDTKIAGLHYDMIKQTIMQGKEARLAILDYMMQTISTHNPNLSPYAPKIYSFTINPEKIREVIGKGGEMIDKIIAACGNCKIDFSDDGSVFISDKNQANIEKAVKMIKDIAEDLPINEAISATITRVEQYGFFVNLPKGKGGLIHGKTLGAAESRNISSFYKVGDEIQVIILGVDDQGRLMLKKA